MTNEKTDTHVDLSARWQELFWALPPGPMRHRLRSLEIDMGRVVRSHDALVAALKGLHDDIAEYARINNIGGFDNHWMADARAALAKATGLPSAGERTAVDSGSLSPERKDKPDSKAHP